MRPFVEDDFPVRVIGNLVYRRLDSSPICTAIDDDMAQEIAKRMNQANQVYPEPEPQGGLRSTLAADLRAEHATLTRRFVHHTRPSGPLSLDQARDLAERMSRPGKEST